MKERLYYVQGPLPSTPGPSGDEKPWETTDVVGEPLDRIDAYERVSGAAVYPSDLVLPRMLYAAVLRCPHAHAKVTGLDSSAAETMPGVHAVIHDGSSGCDVPWYFGADGPMSRLFDPVCRYEGDEVAAIAAETPYQARDALRSISVDYQVLPFVSDQEQALAAGAPPVWPGGNRAGDPGVYERGDVARGFEEADAIHEETYETACEIHAPMELYGCVVRWDGNRLTVWESTQGVYNVQRTLAQAFGLPLSNVRAIGHYVGGGFGSKLAPGKGSVIAAILAKRTGRPVKLFLAREESMLCMGNRPPMRARVKVGVKKDGSLTAIEMEGQGTGGAYSPSGTGLLDWQIRDLYRCANVRTVLQAYYVNAGEERPMRAPGHPQGSWMFEQALDSVAEKIGMDPVALRLQNIPDVSQARGNIPYTSNGYRQCLEEGAKAFGWDEARKRPGKEGALVRGVGVAGCTWVVGGGGPPSTAIVKYFADGSANLNMGASDIGTGTKTVMAMVVSEELGVPLEKIRIEYADTGSTQYATASGGSKTVPTESPAVRAAAQDCRRQILKMAAGQLELPASDLELRGAEVVSKSDSENRVALGAIRKFRERQLVVGVGYRGPNPEGKAVCPFAAQFCEVEVNRRTGEVRIVRFLGAHDSGRVMNRKTYDNQVYGGIVMGIGLGMTERRVLDRNQTGKMVNANLHDYKLPTSMDVPVPEDMGSLPIDPQDTECNTTGAKGLGEPVTIPTAAAIANAVYHATGVRMTSTPINPTTLVGKLSNDKRRG